MVLLLNLKGIIYFTRFIYLSILNSTFINFITTVSLSSKREAHRAMADGGWRSQCENTSFEPDDILDQELVL
jgi:hypothetical protein